MGEGWLQVIRGPKSPSVRWHTKKHAEQRGRGAGRSVRDPGHPKKEQRRCPSEVRSRRFRREDKFGSCIDPRPISSFCLSSRQARGRFDGIDRTRENASGRRVRQNSIHQDEMEQAEKELQEVREEAERQKVGVIEVNPVDWSSCRVPVQTQQRRTPMFVETRTSGDPGSRGVECMVVRTPCRFPRRAHWRPCLCSRAHHDVVRRGRTFGGNDRKNIAMTLTVNIMCRTVTKWGLRGVRVGEASNPGPASKRCRTQRLRRCSD